MIIMQKNDNKIIKISYAYDGCNTRHGHLHTGQLSHHFFLTSDQHEGGNLGTKLHPGVDFLDHDFL